MTPGRGLTAFRVVVLTVTGLFFVVPLLSLVEFSTRGTGIGAPRTSASTSAADGSTSCPG